MFFSLPGDSAVSMKCYGINGAVSEAGGALDGDKLIVAQLLWRRLILRSTSGSLYRRASGNLTAVGEVLYSPRDLPIQQRHYGSGAGEKASMHDSNSNSALRVGG